MLKNLLKNVKKKFWQFKIYVFTSLISSNELPIILIIIEIAIILWVNAVLST